MKALSKSFWMVLFFSLLVYPKAWAQGYPERDIEKLEGSDPKALEEPYENTGLNEEVPVLEEVGKQMPEVKKVIEEDKIPVPVRSRDARRRAARVERYQEKKAKEEAVLNKRGGVVEETKKAPEIRGRARIRREDRVKRHEKIKEREERKVLEGQTSGDSSK